MDFLQGQSHFSSASKHKSPHPCLVFRDEGLTRFVVPPWFGVERPLGHSPPFIRPVTRANRNPLLSFHGFGSEASSTGSRTGLHHPPALLRMLRTAILLDHRFQHSFSRTVVYYSSSLPLKLLFADCLVSLWFSRQLDQHPDDTLDRPQQRIASEHHK